MLKLILSIFLFTTLSNFGTDKIESNILSEPMTIDFYTDDMLRDVACAQVYEVHDRNRRNTTRIAYCGSCNRVKCMSYSFVGVCDYRVK